MSRHLRLLASFALVLLAAACGEVPTAAPAADQLQTVDASASIVPGTCTNLAQLDRLVKKGDIAAAKAQATETVSRHSPTRSQAALRLPRIRLNFYSCSRRSSRTDATGSCGPLSAQFKSVSSSRNSP